MKRTVFYKDHNTTIKVCEVCGEIICVNKYDKVTEYTDRKMRRKLFEYNSFFNGKEPTYIDNSRNCYSDKYQLHLLPL